MLPNFLIIGAEKAATTWLARCLSEHPQAYLPPEKELFFFSTRYDRGIDWYEGHFRDWSGETAVGEATPVYLSHPDAARRIDATLPGIKLIVSLRHPVDRAYSAYWHNLRHGRIAAETDFERAFIADACEIRSRGDYATHLARYLRWFPRERLLALVYEQIGEDPGGELGRCLRYLGLDASFSPSVLHARLNEGGRDLTAATGPVRRVRSALRSGVLSAIRHGVVPQAVERRLVPAAERFLGRAAARLGPTRLAYEPLPEALRRDLYERHYAEGVRRLERLLGLELRRWYEAAGAAPAAAPGLRSPQGPAGRLRSERL